MPTAPLHLCTIERLPDDSISSTLDSDVIGLAGFPPHRTRRWQRRFLLLLLPPPLPLYPEAQMLRLTFHQQLRSSEVSRPAWRTAASCCFCCWCAFIVVVVVRTQQQQHALASRRSPWLLPSSATTARFLNFMLLQSSCLALSSCRCLRSSFASPHQSYNQITFQS